MSGVHIELHRHFGTRYTVPIHWKVGHPGFPGVVDKNNISKLSKVLECDKIMIKEKGINVAL